jgi:hypothetical protein
MRVDVAPSRLPSWQDDFARQRGRAAFPDEAAAAGPVNCLLWLRRASRAPAV